MNSIQEKEILVDDNYTPSPIEDIIKDVETFPNVIERYYTLRYNIDVGEPGNDHRILFHSNKLCIITLAPSHPILRSRKTISRLNFQISKNVNRLSNKMSGKMKRGAQLLQSSSALCFIECSDDTKYTVFANVPGKLIEINENLDKQPQMIDPLGKGYIAIVLADHNISNNLRNTFFTADQYNEAIKNRDVTDATGISEVL